MTAYTKATNFLAKDSLPDTDAGKIIKGSEFDTEFNNLQTAVNSKADALSAALSGTPTAPTATVGTNNTQIATTAFVTTAVDNGFPSGGIIIWSGASTAIPTGWYLCDGNNSTPDLRNRFVVGATDTYNVGDTGGSNSADHLHTTGDHTLTESEMPSHDHLVVKTGTSGDTTYNSGQALTGYNPGYGLDEKWIEAFSSSTADAGNSSETGGDAAHNHGDTGTATVDNRPPYYALCYIMKA